jgi:hypothetical protein
MTHAAKTLQFWSANSMAPIISTDYVDERSEDNQPEARILFDDQSYIEYQVFEGHPDTLVAVNANGDVEANY